MWQFAVHSQRTHISINICALFARLPAYHHNMSTRALNSEEVRRGIKHILLNYSGLWEALRAGG